MSVEMRNSKELHPYISYRTGTPPRVKSSPTFTNIKRKEYGKVRNHKQSYQCPFGASRL